jgi:hypothetical protein
MKTKTPPALTAAFPDPEREPNDAALKAALGASFAALEPVLAAAAQTCPEAVTLWQFSKQSGWYRVAMRKKRRLFYLVPKQGDFRLSLILGGKALASLAEGPQARAVDRLLKTAKRYPEGTAFEFDARSSNPTLFAALLTAKLAH